MTPKPSKSKKSFSGTTTLSTQEFWNRHRATIIPKALVVHNKFKSLGARWDTIYQEKRSAWKEEKQTGRQFLPHLVPPLWQAASLLTTRFRDNSVAFADALGKSDGYKTTKLLKTMEEDAILMESILSSVERELLTFDKQKVDTTKVASNKKKKKKNTTKTIVEI
eukprot:scaffold2243_cov165-Amphora_coffeaeformis.AAC.6